jgi:hypothetical protein
MKVYLEEQNITSAISELVQKRQTTEDIKSDLFQRFEVVPATKPFSLDTIAEMDAYIAGINEGLNAIHKILKTK